MKVMNIVHLIVISLVVFGQLASDDALYQPEGFTKEDLIKVGQAVSGAIEAGKEKFNKFVEAGKERFAELLPKAKEEEEVIAPTEEVLPVMSGQELMTQIEQDLDEYIDTVKTVYEVDPSMLTEKTIEVVLKDPKYRKMSLNNFKELIEMDGVNPDEISRALKREIQNIKSNIKIEKLDARIEKLNVRMADYEQQRIQAHSDGYRMLEKILEKKIAKVENELAKLEAIKAEQE